MNKILAIVALLLVLLTLVTGCMKDSEVCNYDGVCMTDETDNCADCQDTLGRDIIPDDTTENNVNSP